MDEAELPQAVEKISKILRTDVEPIKEGQNYIFLMGNTPIKENKPVYVDDRPLTAGNFSKGSVIHERLILLYENMPIRSHEETSKEIVWNIGGTNIETILTPTKRVHIRPGQSSPTVNGTYGFNHGFKINKEGLLYVAKIIRPEFISGNSFKMPENSYDGPQF